MGEAVSVHCCKCDLMLDVSGDNRAFLANEYHACSEIADSESHIFRYTLSSDAPMKWADAKEGLVCHCCAQDNNWSADPTIVEALTYAPGSFDESHTLDTERSHVRYSRLLVHSGTSMNRPRQRSWEQWLRGGADGHFIVVLNKLVGDGSPVELPSSRVSGTLRFNDSLMQMAIHTKNDEIAISIECVQVICPATNFMPYADIVKTALDEQEQTRAVLLEYFADGHERKRLCFLMKCELTKVRFVQALTSHWLEVRRELYTQI